MARTYLPALLWMLGVLAPVEGWRSSWHMADCLSSVERLVVLSSAAPNRVVCRRFMSKKIRGRRKEPGPAIPFSFGLDESWPEQSLSNVVSEFGSYLHPLATAPVMLRNKLFPTLTNVLVSWCQRTCFWLLWLGDFGGSSARTCVSSSCCTQGWSIGCSSDDNNWGWRAQGRGSNQSLSLLPIIIIDQSKSRHVYMPSCFSGVQLFVTLWIRAYQAPLSMGFSRQNYWSGLPCPPPGGLPDWGIKPAALMSPALAGVFILFYFFTTNTTWEALKEP